MSYVKQDFFPGTSTLAADSIFFTTLSMVGTQSIANNIYTPDWTYVTTFAQEDGLGGMFNTATPDRMLIQRTGTYSFGVQSEWGEGVSTAIDTIIGLRLYNADGTVARANLVSQRASLIWDRAQALYTQARVTAGQYVRMFVYHTKGVANTLTAARMSALEVKQAVNVTNQELILPPRQTVSYTTPTLQPGENYTALMTIARAYRLFNFTSNGKTRVRLYTTVAKRDADVQRAVGVTPEVGSGLVFEYIAGAAGSYDLSPLVDGYQNEATPTSAIPITITNDAAAAAAVTVSFTYVRTE